MVGMVDGVDIGYYDSSIRKYIPRQTWMKDKLDQTYWNSETKLAMMYDLNFQKDIKILERLFNQTGGRFNEFQTKQPVSIKIFTHKHKSYLLK